LEIYPLRGGEGSAIVSAQPGGTRQRICYHIMQSYRLGVNHEKKEEAINIALVVAEAS
jgi:hypothetical protein